MKTRERDIQKQILDYLAYQKDIYFFRSGSGAFKTDQGRYFKTGKRGCPDITVVKNGKAIFLEVKNKNGRLSPDQKQAQADIERAGGVYVVCRGLDEAMKIIN
jgi:hypothetical protein